jgi:hypothetical protein
MRAKIHTTGAFVDLFFNNLSEYYFSKATCAIPNRDIASDLVATPGIHHTCFKESTCVCDPVQ